MDPVFEKAEELVSGLKKVLLSSKVPNVPIKISFVFDDAVIDSSPYLGRQAASQVFELCQEALYLLHQQGVLRNISKIRLLSETLDDVKVIAYEQNKPAFYIDVKAKTVIVLSCKDELRIGST